jgi:hypothetical protein
MLLSLAYKSSVSPAPDTHRYGLDLHPVLNVLRPAQGLPARVAAPMLLCCWSVFRKWQRMPRLLPSSAERPISTRTTVIRPLLLGAR